MFNLKFWKRKKADQSKEATNQNNIIYSQENILIPNKYKTIVIRVNRGEESPYFLSSWSKSGSMMSNGKRGLFGVLLTQKYNFIYRISYCAMEPTFQILEIDKRDIIYRSFLEQDLEVEFKQCNVLFNGDIFSFAIELKKYATSEQYDRLFSILNYKINEINFAKRSNENTLAYIIEVVRRINENNEKY